LLSSREKRKSGRVDHIPRDAADPPFLAKGTEGTHQLLYKGKQLAMISYFFKSVVAFRKSTNVLTFLPLEIQEAR